MKLSIVDPQYYISESEAKLITLLSNPLYSGVSCSYPFRSRGANYVQMPGQGRLKNRLKNKFNHFLHSLVPGRSRSPSPLPNRAITPTPDPQASSTPVSPGLTSIHEIPDPQPLNSPSLSNIHPSFVIHPAGNEASGRMADLVSVGFEGVKTTLRLVERVAGAFPPLKLAVSGLLGVIEIVEVCDFRLSIVMVMVLTVLRQPLRTNKIAKIWSRS